MLLAYYHIVLYRTMPLQEKVKEEVEVEVNGLRRARRSDDFLSRCSSACEDPPAEDGGVAASRDGLSDLLGPSWIRVLFLKQVHLQNVGAPVNREC